MYVIVEVCCVPVVAIGHLSRHLHPGSLKDHFSSSSHLHRVAERHVTVFWVHVFSLIHGIHVNVMLCVCCELISVSWFKLVVA